MKRLFVFLLFITITQSAFADDLILDDVLNGCSSELDPYTALIATFAPNQYQCNSGYYVPANNDGCVVCPEYYDCNGGNFTFDEYTDQGNTFKKIITDDITNGCRFDFTQSVNNVAYINATFTPNQHTCNPGYYMPANYDGCQLCPENSYCPGGTYTFNETVTQGITACASGTYSPVGMWEVAQCGRIFHVGDDVIYLRSVRKTVHALNFDMDMDGVADYFANMTPLNVPMHINSEHGLKILLDGIEYSVYDDTVDLGLYEQ